jgi:hypothetical protein
MATNGSRMAIRKLLIFKPFEKNGIVDRHLFIEDGDR